MNINSVSAMPVERIQDLAAVSLLKKSMDVKEQAVMKLLEGLPTVSDPALGQYVDTFA